VARRPGCASASSRTCSGRSASIRAPASGRFYTRWTRPAHAGRGVADGARRRQADSAPARARSGRARGPARRVRRPTGCRTLVDQQRRAGRDRAHGARLLAGGPAGRGLPPHEGRAAREHVHGDLPRQRRVDEPARRVPPRVAARLRGPAGVLSRALVEGLFGVRPDALAGVLEVAPGFPECVGARAPPASRVSGSRSCAGGRHRPLSRRDALRGARRPCASRCGPAAAGWRR
jgi:hypothetical protein